MISVGGELVGEVFGRGGSCFEMSEITDADGVEGGSVADLRDEFGSGVASGSGEQGVCQCVFRGEDVELCERHTGAVLRWLINSETREGWGGSGVCAEGVPRVRHIQYRDRSENVGGRVEGEWTRPCNVVDVDCPTISTGIGGEFRKR